MSSAPGTPSDTAPRVCSKQLTAAPLTGLVLAREAGKIAAWDDAHTIYLMDLSGELLLHTRPPTSIQCLAISDDGRHIVLCNSDGELWWLGKELKPREHRPGPRHPTALAVTPSGRFVAVSGSNGHTQIWDWYGRPVSELLTSRPLKHLAFLCDYPYLIGAAEYGLIGCYELDGTPRWQNALWSTVGHLSASGDGQAILVACYNRGLERYDLDGINEGAYHLGGAVTQASVDYDHKSFAAATLEGELLLVTSGGEVLWRQMLTGPATGLCLDAAGRRLIYGQQSGEITVLDLYPTVPEASPTATGFGPGDRSSPLGAVPVLATSKAQRSTRAQLRIPSWSVPFFNDPAQAESAVLALVEEPLGIAVFTNRRRLEVLDSQGQCIHRSDPVEGMGRHLVTNGGLVLAGTDREILLYDAASGSSARFADQIVGPSHMAIDTVAGEIVVVDAPDCVSRFDLRGSNQWSITLEAPIAELATGPDGTAATTTKDGRLLVCDHSGQIMGKFQAPELGAMALVRIGRQWVTLAGKSQRIRGHALDGSIQWETVIATEAWRLFRIGNQLVARAAGGRCFVIDPMGQLVLDTTELPHDAQLFADRSSEPLAVYWRAGNLMVADLTGQIRWRFLSGSPQGPVVAGSEGVACAIGRDLVFFPADPHATG